MYANWLTPLEYPQCETLSVPVLRVFDGDGFLTKLQHPHSGAEIELAVRFGFIDAPEIGQPGGQEAKSFLNSLIGGQQLDLAILLKSDTGKNFDRHGRIVAIPYLRQSLDGTGLVSLIRATLGMKLCRNIELEMILNGWAWVLTRYGPDEAYHAALEDAQRHKRGIWARDDNVHPWEFKRRQYGAKAVKMKAVEPNLFPASGTAESCPNSGCHGHLRVRNGRFGKFMGCSNFPACRYSRNCE